MRIDETPGKLLLPCIVVLPPVFHTFALVHLPRVHREKYLEMPTVNGFIWSNFGIEHYDQWSTDFKWI
jgi:hypothetical protein